MDNFDDYQEGWDNDSQSDYEDYYERDTYERYAGTYAQDEAGWSDQMIDEVLEGDPDAYWNLD